MRNPNANHGQSLFDPRTTEALVALLNQSLTETLDLAHWTNQAHSTIKGQTADSLHELFDHLHGQLLTFGDAFAGRTISLGGQVRPTNSCRALSDGIVKSEMDHIHLDALVDRYGEYTGSMRRAIRAAGHLEDHDTAHLYTTVSHAVDKALWLLTAHHEA